MKRGDKKLKLIDTDKLLGCLSHCYFGVFKDSKNLSNVFPSAYYFCRFFRKFGFLAFDKAMH